MKGKTKQKVRYTDDMGEMDDFIGSPILTKEEERALGIPSPEEVKKCVSSIDLRKISELMFV